MAEKVSGRYLTFDSVAEDYDQTRVIPPAQIADIARLCAYEARLSEGGLFLDAGVGTGRFAAPLAHMHPGQIIGADISLPMMAHAHAKVMTSGDSLSLIGADLQNLPFRKSVFRGALIVHILHLIERWPAVLEELHRVLEPRRGVLLLGSEMGGRSALVDFYFERARARQALPPAVGAMGFAEILAYLKRVGPAGVGHAEISPISAPYLHWKRSVAVRDTLSALGRRTYSQMWGIADAAHEELLTETKEYARRSYSDFDATEELRAHFLLHAVRWHSPP